MHIQPTHTSITAAHRLAPRPAHTILAGLVDDQVAARNHMPLTTSHEAPSLR
jgi:hypothetical protein